MNRCPITYADCGNERYSLEGLRLLSSRLKKLNDFPYKNSEQLLLAIEYADKLSFSGVQKKLNASLSISKGVFEIVAHKGHYIIKPQSSDYEELPQNEDLTMKLADCIGIKTPPHGLIYSSDGSLSYFIERFDRTRKNKKIAVEDLSQLAGLSRDTKYDFSMEKIIPLIDRFSTFPLIEKRKLFLLTIFSFLIGNKDLHLKNFSMVHYNGVTEFSPAYDLVNSSIILKTKEELALPLRGKKNKLSKEDLIDYFGIDRLNLSPQTILDIMTQIDNSIPKWKELISVSFLSLKKRKAYLSLLNERISRLI